MKRIYRTTMTRDANADLTQVRGTAIIVTEYEEDERLVTTAPGREEVREAVLISPHTLDVDELLMVEKTPAVGMTPAVDEVFRVLTVSKSRIGRNSYTLTRKLNNAA